MNIYRKNASKEFRTIKLQPGQPFNLYKDEDWMFNPLYEDINIKYSYASLYRYENRKPIFDKSCWYTIDRDRNIYFPPFVSIFAEGNKSYAVSTVEKQLSDIIDECPGNKIVMAAYYPDIEVIPAPPKGFHKGRPPLYIKEAMALVDEEKIPVYADLTCGLFAGD